MDHHLRCCRLRSRILRWSLTQSAYPPSLVRASPSAGSSKRQRGSVMFRSTGGWSETRRKPTLWADAQQVSPRFGCREVVLGIPRPSRRPTPRSPPSSRQFLRFSTDLGLSSFREVDEKGRRMELKGKTAVITGGASGIGLATAIQFSKAGVNIVLGDIEDGPLNTQVEEMRSHGATVIGVHCDVAKEADVEGLRDAALKEFGAVHVIFNNAGVASGSTIGTPKKIWDWVMSVNLDGVVNGMNAFVPLFLEQNEGHVVNISESLFHELANTGKNVHVSVLCPNFVRTRIFESERNMPKELASYAENPEGAEMKKIAAALVNAGIDAADVAKAVEDAVVHEKFWILTHERSALRITELRLEWMRGGPSPTAGLVSVNN